MLNTFEDRDISVNLRNELMINKELLLLLI